MALRALRLSAEPVSSILAEPPGVKNTLKQPSSAVPEVGECEPTAPGMGCKLPVGGSHHHTCDSASLSSTSWPAWPQNFCESFRRASRYAGGSSGFLLESKIGFKCASLSL